MTVSSKNVVEWGREVSKTSYMDEPPYLLARIVPVVSMVLQKQELLMMDIKARKVDRSMKAKKFSDPSQ